MDLVDSAIWYQYPPEGLTSEGCTISEVTTTHVGQKIPTAEVLVERRPTHVDVSSTAEDTVRWLARQQGLVDFSVKDAYLTLDDSYDRVEWTSSVWFKGHIPKHAFCFWVACHHRLPTQDRMLTWKHDPPDWKCSLCGTCMDSHRHLFFECAFSSRVWEEVTLAINWRNAPTDWDVIMEMLSGPNPPRKFAYRLCMAASVYTIWNERNQRLFTSNRKPEIVCAKETIDVIMMRLAWRKMMKTKTSDDAG
ncbi:hypothetical protein OSB04_un000209 [Centaurea solstitialis]|uniref:Reverse transcriptase zinc-binding domain-containing protein n=1 Tax=Centaurea solstitialis TaxID=347529 RepID=A0AA38S6C5_9ASTR|nr:hypothetical protein OSB04_un000209 [Centaurea solstitialis]